MVSRIKVNLTLDAEVTKAARELGLNMSRLAEEAIAQAAKAERNRLWREQNRAALEAYADEIARDGLALSSFRSF
jgi:antitoxin CcdA